MTVSVNYLGEFGRDQILKASIRVSGLLADGQNPTADQIESATVHLTLALQELQATGRPLASIERATPLVIASGTSSYTLPTETIDVLVDNNDTVGMILDTDGNETAVKTMSRAEWQEIGQKSETGTPTRCYIEKLATTVKAIFWPVPDSSTITFRYTKVRLLRAMDTGLTTLDLRQTWTPYLVYKTAVGVCLDNSKVERAALLKNWADQLLTKTDACDVEHGSLQFRINHSGRNW